MGSEIELAEVYFIRHGETTWNVQSRMQGQNNESELTENGKEQTRQLSERLNSFLLGKNVVIWSSDLARAQATAKIIAKGLGLPEESIQLETGLREANFGQFEGTEASFYQTHPNFLHYLANQFFHAIDPQRGESYQRVAARSQEAIRRIMDKSPGKTILIITHGGVLRSLQMQALPVDADPIQYKNVPNTANGEIFKFEPVTGSLIRMSHP